MTSLLDRQFLINNVIDRIEALEHRLLELEGGTITQIVPDENPGDVTINLNEGPDIDVVGTRIGRGGDSILIFYANGDPVAELATLADAAASATSGDTIVLPSRMIAITAGVTLAAGVALVGMSDKSVISASGFSGTAITLSAGSICSGFTLNFVATGTTAIGISACAANALVRDMTVTVSGGSTSNIGIVTGVSISNNVCLVHSGTQVCLTENFDADPVIWRNMALPTGAIVYSAAIDEETGEIWVVTSDALGQDSTTNGVLHATSPSGTLTLVLSQFDASVLGDAALVAAGWPADSYMGELRSSACFGSHKLIVAGHSWPGFDDRPPAVMFMSDDSGASWTASVPSGSDTSNRFWVSQYLLFGCGQIDWDGSTITVAGTVGYPYFHERASLATSSDGVTWSVIPYASASSTFINSRSCVKIGSDVYVFNEDNKHTYIYPSTDWAGATSYNFGFRRTRGIGHYVDIRYISYPTSNGVYRDGTLFKSSADIWASNLIGGAREIADGTAIAVPFGTATTGIIVASVTGAGVTDKSGNILTVLGAGGWAGNGSSNASHDRVAVEYAAVEVGAAGDTPVMWGCTVAATGTGAVAAKVITGLATLLFNQLSGVLYDIQNLGTNVYVHANQYLHSLVTGAIIPLQGDRATYAVEEWHGSDIGASAPTRHVPLPGSDGAFIESAGGEWTRITAIPLPSLSSYARGSIIRGGTTEWEAHNGSTSGFVVQGDGTDVKSAAFDWDTIGAATGADMAHDHSAAGEGGKLAQANTHESADTDAATTSLHHTIGAGATQAAAGNHTHGGIGGHTIQDEGSSLAARTYLNFVGAGVTATDDAGNNATIVTIPKGGEVLMADGVTPPDPLTTEAEDDWLYTD